MSEFTFIDLFCGIGGFTLGLMHDIRILTPEFGEYIRHKMNHIKSSTDFCINN